MDGSGLQVIEDEDLAQRIRAKVNDFNLRSALVVGALAALFAVLPELF